MSDEASQLSDEASQLLDDATGNPQQSYVYHGGNHGMNDIMYPARPDGEEFLAGEQMVAAASRSRVAESLRDTQKDASKQSIQIADDGGEWEEESPETDQTFELALWVIAHRHDISLDPDLVGDKAEVASMIGVKEADFGGADGKLWKVRVNWNQHGWAGKIPAGYAQIHYAGTEVAIIGPWLTIRTCWHCGLKGWRTDVGAAKIGIVLPNVECPHCGEKDWFGIFVTPENFIRDASEMIADECGADSSIYRRMAGKYA